MLGGQPTTILFCGAPQRGKSGGWVEVDWWLEIFFVLLLQPTAEDLMHDVHVTTLFNRLVGGCQDWLHDRRRYGAGQDQEMGIIISNIIDSSMYIVIACTTPHTIQRTRRPSRRHYSLAVRRVQ